MPSVESMTGSFVGRLIFVVVVKICQDEFSDIIFAGKFFDF